MKRVKINAKSPVSKSGRRLTPFPKNKGSRRPANLAWSQWLIENTLEEVKDSSYQVTLVRAVKPTKDGSLTMGDGYSLNELLFGDPEARIDWNMKKVKFYQCKDCGVEKDPQNIFYYVDGNNISITKNAPPLCKECYLKRYKH